MPRTKLLALASVFFNFAIGVSGLSAAPALVPLNGGTLDPTFNARSGGTVLGVQTDGKILISTGDRLNADGSVDTTYQPGGDTSNVARLADESGLLTTTPGPVSTTRVMYVMSDGSTDTAYVQPSVGAQVPSGDFVQFSVPAPYTSVLVTRTHADGSAAGSYSVPISPPVNSTTRNPDFSNNQFNTVFDSQGRLIVAVSPSIAASQVNPPALDASASRIFRLLADGSLDSSYPTAFLDDAIFKLLCAPGSDKLYYCAKWSGGSNNTIVYVKFGRLNADGSVDGRYTPIEHINTVNSLGVRADGSFLLLEPDNVVVRYTPDGQVDPYFALRIPDLPDSYYRVIFSIIQLIPLADGRVLASGTLFRPGGPAYSNYPGTYLQRYAPAPHDPATHLANLSVRASAGTGSATVILGFVVSGQGEQSVLLRAIGPGLDTLVPDHLLDPSLKVYRGSDLLLNVDNWSSVADPAALAALSASLGAFPLVSGSKDAATSAQLSGGAYTLHLTAMDAANGVGLAEIYDANATPADFDAPRLVNISARAPAGSGSDTLIAGFVITGSSTKNVLIRAVGPTLATQNVTGVLADPQLTLWGYATGALAGRIYQQYSRWPIITNDNWDGNAAIQAAATAVGAFALPADSKDAALLITLPPGVYSAQVSPATGHAGIALVEVYEVP